MVKYNGYYIPQFINHFDFSFVKKTTHSHSSNIKTPECCYFFKSKFSYHPFVRWIYRDTRRNSRDTRKYDNAMTLLRMRVSQFFLFLSPIPRTPKKNPARRGVVRGWPRVEGRDGGKGEGTTRWSEGVASGNANELHERREIGHPTPPHAGPSCEKLVTYKYSPNFPAVFPRKPENPENYANRTNAADAFVFVELFMDFAECAIKTWKTISHWFHELWKFVDEIIYLLTFVLFGWLLENRLKIFMWYFKNE